MEPMLSRGFPRIDEKGHRSPSGPDFQRSGRLRIVIAAALVAGLSFVTIEAVALVALRNRSNHWSREQCAPPALRYPDEFQDSLSSLSPPFVEALCRKFHNDCLFPTGERTRQSRRIAVIGFYAACVFGLNVLMVGGLHKSSAHSGVSERNSSTSVFTLKSENPCVVLFSRAAADERLASY